MEKEKENKTGKVIGAIVAGGLLIAAGAGGMGVSNADTIQDQVAQIAELSEYANELNTQIVTLANKPAEIVTNTVEVEKIVEVEKVVETVVEVDNENLQLVLDHIYDNEGNIEYLTDDLDDDEVNEIVDRISFINDIKKLAVDEVKSEGVDELDKEVVGEGDDAVELDDRDIERFRVYDDADELTVDDVDFEDGDADVYVNTRFEQDDVKYIATFRIAFKDNEVDDIDLDSVELRK